MREGHLHHSGIYRNINKRQHLICIRGWGRGNSYVLRMGVVTKDCCQSDKKNLYFSPCTNGKTLQFLKYHEGDLKVFPCANCFSYCPPCCGQEQFSWWFQSCLVPSNDKSAWQPLTSLTQPVHQIWRNSAHTVADVPMCNPPGLPELTSYSHCMCRF